MSLLKTLGIEDIRIHYVKRPNHRFFIQEDFVKSLSNGSVDRPDIIVVYDKLRPWQFYNLSRALRDIEIWDLIMLILKIFELHAGTLEAKLKIELLRIRHQIPFVKEYIRSLKLGEQAGFMGAGVYGYEALLKSMKRKEVTIKRKLKEIRGKRELLTINRLRLGHPTVAIIGYTSVGKTTLYNTLTGDEKVTGPQLFKTLAPKSRAVKTPCGTVIVTDTIGFIRKMPDEVIDVFHAVISEIRYSDIILLMTDLTDTPEDYIEKMLVSIDVLKRVGVTEKPIIVAMNKRDLVSEERIEHYRALTSDILSDEDLSVRAVVPISALRGTGVEELLVALCRNIDHIEGLSRGVSL